MMDMSIKELLDYKKNLIAGTAGQKCEVYSRIVGYYRPVENWNKGKRVEFNERLGFAV